MDRYESLKAQLAVKDTIIRELADELSSVASQTSTQTSKVTCNEGTGTSSSGGDALSHSQQEQLVLEHERETARLREEWNGVNLSLQAENLRLQEAVVKWERRWEDEVDGIRRQDAARFLENAEESERELVDRVREELVSQFETEKAALREAFAGEKGALVQQFEGEKGALVEQFEGEKTALLAQFDSDARRRANQAEHDKNELETSIHEDCDERIHSLQASHENAMNQMEAHLKRLFENEKQQILGNFEATVSQYEEEKKGWQQREHILNEELGSRERVFAQREMELRKQIDEKLCKSEEKAAAYAEQAAQWQMEYEGERLRNEKLQDSVQELELELRRREEISDRAVEAEAKLREKERELTQAYSDLRVGRQKIESQHAKIVKIEETMEKSFEKQEVEYETHVARAEKLQVQLLEAEQRAEAVQLQLEDSRRLINQLKAEEERYYQKLRLAEAKLADAITERDEGSVEIDKAKSEMQRILADNDKLICENDRLTAEKEQVLVAASEQVAALERTQRDKGDVVADLENEVRVLSKENEQLRADSGSLRQDLAKIDEVVGENNRMVAESEGLLRENEGLRGEVERLQKENAKEKTDRVKEETDLLKLLMEQETMKAQNKRTGSSSRSPRTSVPVETREPARSRGSSALSSKRPSPKVLRSPETVEKNFPSKLRTPKVETPGGKLAAAALAKPQKKTNYRIVPVYGQTFYQAEKGDPVDEQLASFLNKREHSKILFSRVSRNRYLYGRLEVEMSLEQSRRVLMVKTLLFSGGQSASSSSSRSLAQLGGGRVKLGERLPIEEFIRKYEDLEFDACEQSQSEEVFSAAGGDSSCTSGSNGLTASSKVTASPSPVQKRPLQVQSSVKHAAGGAAHAGGAGGNTTLMTFAEQQQAVKTPIGGAGSPPLEVAGGSSSSSAVHYTGLGTVPGQQAIARPQPFNFAAARARMSLAGRANPPPPTFWQQQQQQATQQTQSGAGFPRPREPRSQSIPGRLPRNHLLYALQPPSPDDASLQQGQGVQAANAVGGAPQIPIAPRGAHGGAAGLPPRGPGRGNPVFGTLLNSDGSKVTKQLNTNESSIAFCGAGSSVRERSHTFGAGDAACPAPHVQPPQTTAFQQPQFPGSTFSAASSPLFAPIARTTQHLKPPLPLMLPSASGSLSVPQAVRMLPQN